MEELDRPSRAKRKKQRDQTASGVELGGALAATRERLLDDFVALSLLVGNDFLPHLPSLHIHEGALDELLAMYVALRPVLAAGREHSWHWEL